MFSDYESICRYVFDYENGNVTQHIGTTYVKVGRVKKEGELLESKMFIKNPQRLGRKSPFKIKPGVNGSKIPNGDFRPI